MQNSKRRGAAVLVGALAVIGAAVVGVSVAGASRSATPTWPAYAPAATKAQCGTKSINIAVVQPVTNTYSEAIGAGIKQYFKNCSNVHLTNFDTGFDAQTE